MSDDDRARGRARLGRLHWRLRGAWLWPTFVVAIVLETALLHWLPVEGDATGWVGGLIGVGCLNLMAVALVGALGGSRLRRRRPDMPRVVAENYAGTAVLGIVAAGLLVAGIVHRPAVQRRRVAFGEQSLAVRTWVGHHGDAYARAHVSQADSLLVDEDLYRTCVPTPDPKRWLCLVVNTATSPPAVRLDRNREPNAQFDARPGL